MTETVARFGGRVEPGQNLCCPALVFELGPSLDRHDHPVTRKDAGPVQHGPPLPLRRSGVSVPPERRGCTACLGDQFVRAPDYQVTTRLHEAVDLVEDRLAVGAGVWGGRGGGA